MCSTLWRWDTNLSPKCTFNTSNSITNTADHLVDTGPHNRSSRGHKPTQIISWAQAHTWVSMLLANFYWCYMRWGKSCLLVQGHTHTAFLAYIKCPTSLISNMYYWEKNLYSDVVVMQENLAEMAPLINKGMQFCRDSFPYTMCVLFKRINVFVLYTAFHLPHCLLQF